MLIGSCPYNITSLNFVLPCRCASLEVIDNMFSVLVFFDTHVLGESLNFIKLIKVIFDDNCIIKGQKIHLYLKS